MLDSYFSMGEKREAMGIPNLPLNEEQTTELCGLLENPPSGKEDLLLNLLKNRIAPGVDPSAKIKAAWLNEVAKGSKKSPIVSSKDAVVILGTMMGGYNVDPLIDLLSDSNLGENAAEALKNIVLVYNGFDKIKDMSSSNENAMKVLKSWANGDWFLEKEAFPEEMTLKVFKVDGEINTDDFSPAKHAWSRPDIPQHALVMGETRFPGGNDTIKKFRNEDYKVAFVGDVVGTGSSRKSACNSVMWHIGEDIPFVPNKRTHGIVLGGLIAPIFFNTAEDCGGLPLMADVTSMNTGDIISLDFKENIIKNEKGDKISDINISPATLKDEYRAGGRLMLIIGRNLTNQAREVLGMEPADFFIQPNNPEANDTQGYSLAQKIVGKAAGTEGVLPGSSVEAKMTTVGSQDTTGPMTRDELTELACLEFQSEMFMQSFCHTAAYPKSKDVEMHETLPSFINARKGVSLRPGDGVIHSWLNRLLLPDTLGTGGDSHTRFPIGLSFPAGSGLVAFAGALGFMPLDMPESVLVKFKGKRNPGITLRDIVNAIPYFAIQQGLLTVEKKNKKNIFNGRILEMEGLSDLTVEQAFELTDATAERSAAGGTIQLSEEKVANYLRSNVKLMKKMIHDGYATEETLQRRIEDVEKWLENPKLLRRDENAKYAAVIEIDLADIKEPILACPNDPDDVKLLSEVAGTKIDEVFVGSCMTNIGHFRAAGKVLEGEGYLKNTRMWMAPPTKMDETQLKKEGYYSIYSGSGVRTEIPGCSLCMGNQARVEPGSTVISTSTRNFDNRIGDGAQVFLGSAELAAMAALLGKLPSPEEYLKMYNEKIAEHQSEIYRYLEFDKMGDFSLSYVDHIIKEAG